MFSATGTILPGSADLPTLNLIQVITDVASAKSGYTIDRDTGSLFLTDGTKRTVRVSLPQGGLSDYLMKGKIERFFEIINPLEHPDDSSLYHVFNTMMTRKFEDRGNAFRNSSKALDIFCASHGMSKVTFDKLELPIFLKECENLDQTIKFCVNVLPSEHIRKIVAKTLKNQEDQILASVPSNFLKNPDLLRSHFVKLLAEKGLTYEDSVALFNWGNGKPKDPVVEDTYVLAKLIAQVDAWKALRSKKGGENFPFGDVWRFFIDESKEVYGPYFFENEPFYMLSSLRGLKEILESEEEFSQKTYEAFAAAILLNPPVMKGDRFLTDDSHSLDNRHEFFAARMVGMIEHPGLGFDGSNWKQDSIGIADLEQRTAAYKEAIKRLEASGSSATDEDYWITNATGFKREFGYQISAVTNTSTTIIAQRIVLGREEILAKARTPGERLIAYIWAARELEITHQLDDGNGRSSITTLIKWIADDPELPNYIPEDPNILDQQGPEQLLRDVYSGMRRFKDLSKENLDDMVDVETLIDQAGVRGKSKDRKFNEVRDLSPGKGPEPH